MDSLMYEEGILSYYLFHLLEEKIVALDDDISKLDICQSDHEKVAELIKKNVLGVHSVKVFSLKMAQNKFVFIFAESRVAAIHYYTFTFKKSPLNCIEFLLETEFIRGNEILSFREMKKEHEKFPAVAGYFEGYQ